MAVEETVYCPACNQPARVPTDLLGGPVQCPRCYAYFRVPPRDPEGVLPPPERLPPPPAEAPEPALRRAEARKQLSMAAALLILVAAGGLLVNGAILAQARLDPGRFAEDTKNGLAKAAKMIDAPEPTPESVAEAVALRRRASLWSAAGWLLTVVGGVAMFARRSRPLGALGAIAGMVNFVHCCCVPGIPVGFWALLTLFDAEIAQEFERGPVPPPPGGATSPMPPESA